MKFFFDHCISHRHAEMLRVYKYDVVALKEVFPVETRDDVWIPEIGKRGWVLVTVDRNIKARPHERLALEQSKVTAFFLVKGFADQKLLSFAAALLDVWLEIHQMAEQSQPGEIYRVPLRGKVELF